MNRLIFLLLSSLFLFSVACSTSDDTNAIDIRFMAAEQSGAWYPLAVGITQIMKKEMPNLGNISIIPGGGISNAVGINKGTAELGFSQASSIVDALAGNPPFETKAENITYMLSLFPHKTHVMVLRDSGIQEINELVGKRINVGTKGLLTEDIARRLLDVYGLSYGDMGSVQNLSFSDSVVQMKDGRLDALFWTVPTPFAVLTDLSLSEEIDLINIPEEKINQLIASNTGLTQTVIKAGTYQGVNYDITTIQSPIVMIANSATDEDIVYYATKTVYENLDALKLSSANLKEIQKEDLLHDIDVPLHPGAKKYLTEIGIGLNLQQ
ncbi:MAG: TAXI family TRAP transporter solute-binding subunit [Gammaproteobacteria bacterium]